MNKTYADTSFAHSYMVSVISKENMDETVQETRHWARQEWSKARVV